MVFNMVKVDGYKQQDLKSFLKDFFSVFLQKDINKVLIKPNWGGRFPILKGENTDSGFLKVLTEILYERKVEKIYIAHYSLLKIRGKDYSFENILNITGINKVKLPPVVELVNLDNADKKPVKSGDFVFNLPLLLDEVDFYIDLAKLKTHMETKVTLALKNQMGLLPSYDKINMHKRGLEKGIALLAKAVRPDLSVIDGIVSMDTAGPHHGRTRQTNLVIVGDDIVECDSMAAYLMGLDPAGIEHINYAQALNVGKMLSSEDKIKYKSYIIPGFIPADKSTKKFNFCVWPTTACSRCIFNLDSIKDDLKKDLFLLLRLFFKRKGKINIVIGKGNIEVNNNEETVILIGDCAKDLANKKEIDYLAGCPPTAHDMFEFIKKRVYGHKMK